MNAEPLDMSILAKDFLCGEEDYVRLHADGTRPITLDFKATDVEPPALGKTLVMQARVGVQELWGIRMLPSGRLLIQPGTQLSRESRYGYPGELALGVSFNPLSGTLSILARDLGEATGESFNLTARTPWVSCSESYEVILGAPKSYADRAPLGWRIDCSFRYGNDLAEQRAEFLEDWRKNERAAECHQAVDPSIRKGLGEIVSKANALAESVQDLDNERHWEAMLALASGRKLSDPQEISHEAAELVNAHNAWKEGRS